MEHYLDNAATTKPCVEAVAALMHGVSDCYGNPSSLHRKGLDAQHTMDAARELISTALGCKPAELLFTSGATESNNLALRGIAGAYGKRRKKIIVSSVEHASVKETLAYLETKGFTIVTVSPGSDGKFDPMDFVNQVDKDTCLVSMMLVNNETGDRLPVEEVFRRVKRLDKDVLTHCDAVQGFLKVPFKTRTLGADLISISGHKVHGVKGIGALYVRQGVRVQPILFGGHQGKGIRPGTESVPLIAAFGAAVCTLSPNVTERYEKVQGLRQMLIAKLQQMEGVVIRDRENASPYVLSISLLGYRSEIVLHFLEKREIYLSSGSACSKGASSGVLEQYGAKPEEVDSALRISFCADTTEEDILALVEGLQDAQRELLRQHRTKNI